MTPLETIGVVIGEIVGLLLFLRWVRSDPVPWPEPDEEY